MRLKTLKFYIKRPDIAVRKILFNIHIQRNPNDPWLVPKAVKFCDKVLKKDMTVFEWGSGRSTTWFAERVKNITSIEYNQSWFHNVTKDIAKKNIKNIELLYIPLDHDIHAPVPSEYNPLPKYAEKIKDYKNIDFIIVDGHYRKTCIKACLNILSPGGYLLIDDTYREKNLTEWGVPSNWQLVHQSGNGFMETTIVQKPV